MSQSLSQHRRNPPASLSHAANHKQPAGVRATRTDAGSHPADVRNPATLASGSVSHPMSPVQSSEPLLLDPGIVELETLLRELLVEHEQLLTVTGMQKRAIAGANTDALASCVHQQNVIVQRVAELEKRRLGLVSRLGERLRPAQSKQTARATGIVPDRPTIAWLAQSFPEPTRGRVVAAADRLRGLLKTLHKEHVALKEATTTLATHMEGVLRQVAGRLSHAGTYGRRGIIETRVQVVSTLDMKS